MAEFVNYAITITFRPEFTFKDKMKLIRKIPRYFSGKNMDWELNIEYFKHKIGHPLQGQDNPNNPHIHIWLKMEDNKNRAINVECMIMNYKRNYGRIDFQVLHTENDITLWREYIKKDEARLNLLYPTIRHNLKLIKPKPIKEI